MENVFILGATNYSFMVHSFIEQEGQYKVLGHTVNESCLKNMQVVCDNKNISLFALEKLADIFSNEKIRIINTIGYTNMNKTRQKLYGECLKFGYEVVNFISNRAIVLSEIKGQGNIVFPGAYIGTDVNVGDNNVFYASSVFTHNIIVGDNNFFAANVTCGGEVTIGNNCFIGMGATLRNRIFVKDYTLVGAASYLAHSSRENEVIVPTKSITLDKKSFEISLTPKLI